MDELQVGGFTPLTTTDFPGCLAAVVFCQGCPWRCGYCQNPHLIPPASSSRIPWSDILTFLRRRIGLLDGVIFSGGEPTLQSALGESIRDVRQLGFKVGLHSASPYPEKLAEILPHLDWVGFDVKARFVDYAAITGVPGSGEKARAGLLHLLSSGVAYEVRTTVHPHLHSEAGLLALAGELRDLGVNNFVLQGFRAQGCASPELCINPAPLRAELIEQISSFFPNFTIRQA
jgi:pyruvate formate lyase activating enzyme